MKIPNNANAFENIRKACDRKISELYPVKVPEDIISRYKQELAFLRESEIADDFEIFRLLSKESVKCSTAISMRGTVMGSFLYYLLGNNCFNPLPVHYYCPQCGHYERVHTHLFGIDLPEKICPDCGNPILADGYNMSPESVWGNNGKKSITFEYNVSSEFLPFAKRVLASLYPDNCVVPWGMFQFDPNVPSPYSDAGVVGVNLTGYAILPKGNTLEDYPDLISYLENGDPCVTGGGWELERNFLKPVRLFPSEYIEILIRLQRATGVYANEISNKDIRNITWSNIYNTTILNTTASNFFHELKPKTFRDMISIESASHSTFTWQEAEYKALNAFINMISSDAFQKYPCFTREDFFDYLTEEGFDRKFAFDISEHIWKGHANSSKFREEFEALQIPNEMKAVAGNYLYVFPRAHCIEYMLIFARIAYYAKIDSRVFGKIVFKGR